MNKKSFGIRGLVILCGFCLLALASFAFVTARAETKDAHVPVDDPSIPVWATLYEDMALVIYRAEEPVTYWEGHGNVYDASIPQTFMQSREQGKWESLDSATKRLATSIVIYDKAFPKTGRSFFYDFREVTKIEGIENLDVSNCEDLSSVFSWCTSLKELDLSSWDTSHATDMSQMFYACSNLQSVSAASWDTSNVTTVEDMFHGCTILSRVHGTKDWNLSSCRNMSDMFSDCTALVELDVSGFGMSSATNMFRMFRNCGSLIALDTLNWNTSQVTNMGEAFSFCRKLEDLDTSGWNVSNVTNMKQLFMADYQLKALDVSQWNVSNVTSMDSLFNNCNKVTVLDVSDWKTANVTNMDSLFGGCSEVTALDVSQWDVSNVTSMDSMFSGCRKITALDVSGWNVSNVTNMNRMFSYCDVLQDVDLSKWETNASVLTSMFQNCPSLKQIDFSGFLTDTSTSSSANKICSGTTCLERVTVPNSTFGKNVLRNIVEGKRTVFKPDAVPVASASSTTELQALFEKNVLEGDWAIGQTITFDGMGGSLTRVTKYVGAAYDAPVPTRAGYEFDGWWTKAAGGEAYDGTIRQTMYYAHWVPHAYTLTLKANDMTERETSVNLKFDETYQLSSSAFDDPSYSITSWNTKKDGSGTSYKAADVVSGLTDRQDGTYVLYAQWSNGAGQIVISFDTNGGRDIPSIDVTDKQDASGVAELKWTDLPVPTREGYVFLGWALPNPDWWSSERAQIEREDVPNGYMTYGSVRKYRIPESCTLLAIWEETPTIRCHVQNEAYDVIPVPSDYRVSDSSITEIKEEDGYFYYFELSRTGIEKKTDGSRLPTLKRDEATGKEFLGWYDGSTPTDEELKRGFSTVSADTTDLYAFWRYRLDLDPNEGNLPSTCEPIVSETADYTASGLPEPTRDGYRFLGWYADDERVEDGTALDLSKVHKLVARWEQEAVYYHVTYQTTDGKFPFVGDKLDSTYVGPSSEKEIHTYVKAGDAIGPLPRVEVASTTYEYTFLNWTDDAGNEVTDAYVPTGDTTLTANFVRRNIQIAFYDESGTYLLRRYVAKGDCLHALPGAPTAKSGYYLDGWYEGLNGEGAKLTPDMTFLAPTSTKWYAHWLPSIKTATAGNAEFTYLAEWSNASNVTVDNLNRRLDFHPQSNGSIVASLHVRFEVNKTDGSETLPKGSIKIRVPGHIWENVDGEKVGRNNVSANLPLWTGEESTNRMTFSYYMDGDDVVMINNRDLAGGTGLDFTIAYTLSWGEMRNVLGGAIRGDGYYVPGYPYWDGEVPITFTIDNDMDGTCEFETTETVNHELHTKCVISLKNRQYSYNREWDSSWGKNPNAVDDTSVYVRWGISYDTRDRYNSQAGTFVLHDSHVDKGTIAGMFPDSNYAYAVSKHRKDDFADSALYGYSITNYATGVNTWLSGYQEGLFADYRFTVHEANYPTGQFTKNNRDEYGKIKTVSGGQDKLVYQDKEVDLQYYLGYDGLGDGAQTIVLQDGLPGDVTYSSARGGAVWEPLTGSTALTDSDYYIKYMYLYASVSDELDAFDGVSKYVPSTEPVIVDVYTRSAGSDEFVYRTTETMLETSSNSYGHRTFSLNNRPWDHGDIVAYEFHIRTEARQISVEAYTTFTLKPTERVKSLVLSDMGVSDTSYIKNAAHCTVLDDEGNVLQSYTNREGGTYPATKEIYELTKASTTQTIKKDCAEQTSVHFDVDKGVQDDPVALAGWNYNNGGYLSDANQGTFYDLLPAGTSVNPDTVFLIPVTNNRLASEVLEAEQYHAYKNSESRLGDSFYDVELIGNWEGSGRTMLKISYTAPDDKTFTGMEAYYLLHNTYENVIARGTTLTSECAFVNESATRAKPTTLNGSLSAFGMVDAEWFASLNTKHDGYVSFASGATNYIPVDAFSWKFDTMVDDGAGSYEAHGDVTINDDYVYRLSYTQSDYARGTDIVFYDVLEHGASLKDTDGNVQDFASDWHGTLDHVDVSSLKLLPNEDKTAYCDPVVWYSTMDRDAFDDSAFDLSNAEVWSTTMPEDRNAITAVAVDCRRDTNGNPFVLKGFYAAECFLHVTASKDASLDGRNAYNEGFVSAKRDTEEGATREYSGTSVTLHDVNPTFHKTSSPVSGSEAHPTPVHEDDVIYYDLAVANEGEYEMFDVAVSDTLQDGLRLDTEGMRVKFGSDEAGTKVTTSPRITFVADGQILTFTVKRLRAGEACVITVPVQVGVKEGTVTNTAEAVSVNGVEKHVTSETAYHRVVPTGLSVLKTDGSGTPLSGARLQLLDEAMNVLDEWTSDDDLKHFSVKPGTYYVKELEAPENHFGTDEPVKAVLKRNGDLEGDLNFVRVVNEGTKVKVSKVDGDGNFVVGARLGVFDGETCIHEWTSGNEPELLEGILNAGGTYELRELAAPEGYFAARPISFTMPETNEVLELTMVDRAQGGLGSLKVTETVAGNMGDRSKAFDFTLTLGYEADGVAVTRSDGTEEVLAGTVRDGETILSFTLSDGEWILFDGLPDGASYTVEQDAPGYEVASENEAGTLDFSASDMVTAPFTSTRNVGLPTGALPGVGVGLLSIGLLGILHVKRKRD